MIGMRNIKTSISVFLSIIICSLLKFESSFYAAIAALVCMQPSIEKTYITGKNRILGTLVGAFLGFIFSSIFPKNPLFSALGIIIIICICNRLQWNDTISMAGIVFLSIMLTNMDKKHALVYSIKRTFETLIGIVVAFIVNTFIAPPEN